MLGELEQLVLLAALRVGPEAYAVSIAEALDAHAGRAVLIATVHRTLARLEEKGLVASRMGEPTPQRGGRRKRHYAVTPAGRRELAESLEAVRALARGLRPGWEAS
jgi:PadR family transcriptional regulator, regulatory protein PadR